MHFALPPRKTSHPPLYARAAARSVSNRRKAQVQTGGLAVLGIAAVVLLLYKFIRTSPNQTSPLDSGIADVEPKIVILTILDEQSMSEDYIHKIRTNRDDYAARHGYMNFYTNVTTYQSLFLPSPNSWALVPALRHALTLHPTCTHIFSLTANALISNPSLSLTSHILHPNRLPNLMLKDIPVVPPDSVIHTFSHLTTPKVDVILSQDIDNLAHTSLLLRNSDWSRYFLDAWFDPLYRLYNFQKAEGHALEHIVQWHPTILAKLVLVQQRVMNSYNYVTAAEIDRETNQIREQDSMWQEGDFVINLHGCKESTDRDCGKEMTEYYAKWEKEVKELDGGKAAREKQDETVSVKESGKRKRGR